MGRSRNKQMKKELSGHKISVPRVPPSFTAAPWYPLTIVAQGKFVDKNPHCFSVNDTILAWQKQTGVKLATLCLRFQKLRVWETSNQPIEVAVDQLPDGTQCTSYSDSATVLFAYPGKLQFASLGYQWSVNNRQQVKTAAEGTTVVFRAQLLAGGSWTAYIDVLWSFGSISLLQSAANWGRVLPHSDLGDEIASPDLGSLDLELL